MGIGFRELTVASGPLQIGWPSLNHCGVPVTSIRASMRSSEHPGVVAIVNLRAATGNVEVPAHLSLVVRVRGRSQCEDDSDVHIVIER